jgi:hypothetical protein
MSPAELRAWLAPDRGMTRMPCGEDVVDALGAVTAHESECDECAAELACDPAADRIGWAAR